MVGIAPPLIQQRAGMRPRGPPASLWKQKPRMAKRANMCGHRVDHTGACDGKKRTAVA